MRSRITLGLLLLASVAGAQSALDSLLIKNGGNLTEETKELVRYWQEMNTSNRSKLPGSSGMQIRYKELAKAPQDGCYYGIGNEKNTYEPFGMSSGQCIECEEGGGKIKKNQSYIWSLTQGNGQIYYGTNTNYLCNTISEINKQGNGMIPVLPPYENQCWVCEYGESQTGKGDDLFGDWLHPRIYHYNPETGTNEDVTPEECDVLDYTYGLRSGGSLGDVSFIGGPNKADGISLYAYNNKEGHFIGALNMMSLPGWDGKIPYNIRRWVVAKGVLYCGVEYHRGDGTKGGAVMKWTGNAEKPFDFEVVGWTKGGAAELVFLNDRIYVGTWPAAIAQSPVMEGESFEKITADDDVAQWPIIFNYGTHYDPDMIQGAVASNGGMCVYNGQIYFGTMHMTWGNHFMISNLYRFDQTDTNALLSAWLGSYRAATLFRLTDYPGEEGASSYKVELLYGEEELPAYDFATQKWSVQPTKMGAPLYGRSGFNNMFINYIWAMSVLNDKLYIGTMDFTNLIVPQVESLEQYLGVSYPPYMVDILYSFMSGTNQMGFNMMCIEDKDATAKLVNATGFENEAAMGVRNMITVDDKIYLGTANPLNLHETGGWQLFEMAQSAPFNRPEIVWNPSKMTYGDLLSENQMNAEAVYENQRVPGSYNYTIQQRPVEDISALVPGKYNFRVEFVPEDQETFAVLNKKMTLTMDKAALSVIAEDAEIEVGEALPETFDIRMEGFKNEEDESVLDQQPVAKAETESTEIPGAYPISVSGGESSLYEFNYTNGTLTIRVPDGLEKVSGETMQLYPVPFKDMIHLKSEQPVLSVSFTSLTGETVLEFNNPGEALDVTNLSPGTYVLSIRTASGVIARKVVKTK